MNMTMPPYVLMLFAERVPISTYEEFQPLIERTNGEQNIFWETPIKWFAKSSGTTNAKIYQ
jgi:hypothetical protein